MNLFPVPEPDSAKQNGAGRLHPTTGADGSPPVGTPLLSAAPEPEFRRREWMTEPGEPLLLSRDPIESVIRFGQFSEQTGIDTDSVYAGRLVAIPLPIYPETWAPGTRRWGGTKAQMMWHPIMWLPTYTTTRQNLPSDRAEGTSPETDDEWAIRVALELTASGLYDDATGTWLDVLATVGIDIDRPEAQARVAAWLSGRSDPELDGIDLSEWMTDPEDPDWASHSAAGLLPDLLQFSWALGADSLLAVLDSLPSEVSEHGMEGVAVATVAETVAFVGHGWMIDIPDSTAAIMLETAAEQLGAMTGPSPAEVIDGPVAYLSEALAAVRDRFWPIMEKAMGGVEGLVLAGEDGS